LNPAYSLVQEQSVEEEKPKSNTMETHLNESAPIEKKPTPRTTHYTRLSTFKWDEELEKVKVLSLTLCLFNLVLMPFCIVA
jgi:hypothetical protein